MRVFAEIGFGNETFKSTEFEREDGTEYRIPAFIRPKVVRGKYVRVWLFRLMFVFSTNDGFEVVKKGRAAFKLLYGISGSV